MFTEEQVNERMREYKAKCTQLCKDVIREETDAHEKQLADKTEGVRHLVRLNERLANKNSVLTSRFKDLELLALTRSLQIDSLNKRNERLVSNYQNLESVSFRRSNEHEVMEHLYEELGSKYDELEQQKLQGDAHMISLQNALEEMTKEKSAADEEIIQLKVAQGVASDEGIVPILERSLAQQKESGAFKDAEIGKLSKENETLVENIKSLQIVIVSNEESIECLRSTLAAKDEALAAKGEIVANQEEFINQMVPEFNAKVAKMKEECAMQLESLSGRIKESENNVAENERKLQALEGTLEETRGSLEAKLIEAEKERVEVCGQAQFLFKIVERSEEVIAIYKRKQAEHEESSKALYARLGHMEEQASPCPWFHYVTTRIDPPLPQLDEILLKTDSVHLACQATRAKDAAEWSARVDELIRERDQLLAQPKRDASSPKSNTRKLEQELDEARKKLAERDVDQKRIRDAADVARASLNAQRDKLKAAHIRADKLEADVTWLKKQSRLLSKSNEVFLSQFLYAVATAFPDIDDICKRLTHDDETRGRVFTLMGGMTTRAVPGCVGRVCDMVEMLERDRPELLRPVEDHVNATLVEEADGTLGPRLDTHVTYQAMEENNDIIHQMINHCDESDVVKALPLAHGIVNAIPSVDDFAKALVGETRPAATSDFAKASEDFSRRIEEARSSGVVFKYVEGESARDFATRVVDGLAARVKEEEQLTDRQKALFSSFQTKLDALDS